MNKVHFGQSLPPPYDGAALTFEAFEMERLLPILIFLIAASPGSLQARRVGFVSIQFSSPIRHLIIIN